MLKTLDIYPDFLNHHRMNLVSSFLPKDWFDGMTMSERTCWLNVFNKGGFAEFSPLVMSYLGDHGHGSAGVGTFFKRDGKTFFIFCNNMGVREWEFPLYTVWFARPLACYFLRQCAGPYSPDNESLAEYHAQIAERLLAYSKTSAVLSVLVSWGERLVTYGHTG